MKFRARWLSFCNKINSKIRICDFPIFRFQSHEKPTLNSNIKSIFIKYNFSIYFLMKKIGTIIWTRIFSLNLGFFESSIDNWIFLIFFQKRHLFKNYYRKKYNEIKKTESKTFCFKLFLVFIIKKNIKIIDSGGSWWSFGKKTRFLSNYLDFTNFL